MKVKELLDELKDKDPEMPLEEALSFSVKIEIYEIYERECDEEDCVGYLKQMGYEAATEDKDFINRFVSQYRHKYDSEYGTWDNIDGTISYLEEELKKYTSTGDCSDEGTGGDCM